MECRARPGRGITGSYKVERANELTTEQHSRGRRTGLEIGSTHLVAVQSVTKSRIFEFES